MKIKVIYNYTIPFKGYLAMAMWPFVFARKDARNLTDEDINHESIHCYQQIEMMILSVIIIALLVIFFHISAWFFVVVPFTFYIWYGVEYAIRSIIYENTREGYRNIAVEQEAYGNEKNLDYLKTRKPFAWIRYIGKKTFEKRI